MDILSLTTTEAVRALLGIDSKADELPDEVFSALGIDDLVQLSLERWLPVTFSVALSGSDAALRSLSACVLYQAALLMLPSLRHAAANKLGDGQNEFQRQPRDFAALRDELEQLLARYQQAFLATQPSSTTAITWFSAVAPATDPVTG